MSTFDLRHKSVEGFLYTNNRKLQACSLRIGNLETQASISSRLIQRALEFILPDYGQTALPDRVTHHARSSEVRQKPLLLTKKERDLAAPLPEPSEIVFDGDVERMSKNHSNMERDIMRLHTSWGHVGPKVLKQMLIASGTQKHKRLARKIHELSPLCNACLERRSQTQPHSRDHSQPTSKATRALQRICADSTGRSNIPTLGGYWYAYIHSCQYTSFSWMWMVASMTQVKAIVDDWLCTVIKQKRLLRLDPGKAIEFWRSDSGPEFSTAFTHMLKKYEIYHERTASKA